MKQECKSCNVYGLPFDKVHFLTSIDLISEFVRDWDTLRTNSINGKFIAIQMKVFSHKKLILALFDNIFKVKNE